MIKIEIKPLPNGKVPTEEISNPQVKRVVMLLNENIQSLKTQLADAQRAIIELQRR